MVLRSCLSVGAMLMLLPQSGGSQLIPSEVSYPPCDPCTIVLDTVAIIRSTEADRVMGTPLFEKVGTRYVLAPLLEGKQVHIYDSEGDLIGVLPSSENEDLRFGLIRGLRAVSADSVAVFDAEMAKAIILPLNGGGGREVGLPTPISLGGGLIQDSFMVTAPGQREEPAEISIGGPGGRSALPIVEPEDSRGQEGFEWYRILGHGTPGTFWVLHFLTYQLDQHDFRSGEMLHRVIRDPSWIGGEKGEEDWRYSSLLAAFQPSQDLLWVLGRSIDPEYSFETAPAETPLAGREEAWDLELELLSIDNGALLGSLSLPYWVGGFTSEGLFFFFDEQESDWGQIVVANLRIEEG